MNEMNFVMEECPEQGYLAKLLGVAVFTQAEHVNDLHEKLRAAVEKLKIIRSHFVRTEVIAA